MNKLLKQLYIILPTAGKEIWNKIEHSDIGSRIVKGGFWALSGQIISKGILLFSTFFLVHILGKQHYGELGIIRSTVNMFAVFASFGMGLTATKYISQLRNVNPKQAGRIIALSNLFVFLLGMIIVILLIYFADNIAINQLHAPHLNFEIKLGAIILLFSALNGAQSGILAGFEKFNLIAKSNLIAGIISFPVQIFLAYYWELPGAVIGFGSYFVLIAIISELMIFKICKENHIKIDYRNAYKEWRIIFSFSLPLLIINILITSTMWWCNTYLVKQPNGFEEMALFDVANQWRMTLLFIPTALSQIILPIISSVQDVKTAKKVMKINLKLNFIIALAGAILLFIFSPFIFKAYGNSFKDGIVIFNVLMISSILIATTNVFTQHILSKGSMWKVIFINIVFSFTLFISSYFLIPKYLSVGLGISYILAYLINLFSQFKLSKYLFKNDNN